MADQPTTRTEGFTPGPWNAKTKAEMSPSLVRLLRPNGYSAYISKGDGDGGGWLGLATVIVKTEDGESAEGLANARLIAAAPELYAACEAARNMISPVEDPSDEVGHRVLGLLNAALAKAGGVAHV